MPMTKENKPNTFKAKLCFTTTASLLPSVLFSYHFFTLGGAANPPSEDEGDLPRVAKVECELPERKEQIQASGWSSCSAYSTGYFSRYQTALGTCTSSYFPMSYMLSQGVCLVLSLRNRERISSQELESCYSILNFLQQGTQYKQETTLTGLKPPQTKIKQ